MGRRIHHDEEMMEEFRYRSWVEVDLDNFIENLQQVKRLLAPRVRILQVVKADAYGHGAIEIAHTAIKHGAYGLGVANADEGVQLRVGDVSAPIIILSPSIAQEIPEIIKYNLIPSVSDLAFIRELDRKYREVGKKAKVHIEIDTGMGRGGTIHLGSLALIRGLSDFANVEVEGLFTHLSRSESATSPSNQKQGRLFQEVIDTLRKDAIPVPLLHMANSGGIMNYPRFHLDMVRPGLMTYGVYPSNDYKGDATLHPVMSFKTRILLIKDFPSGQGIGYGSTFITSRPTKIATIPVGYGDGYGFILSNNSEALIRGQRASIVGRISMDMSTIDVTHIPDCEVGDEVVLLGCQGNELISADDLAARASTISYEILCALGKRAPRVYMVGGRQETIGGRLRRIFIPDEEKSISRIDNVIRGCLHTRVNDAEFGDAIFTTMLEALFGKKERQLELRSHFKYHLRLRKFDPDEIALDHSCHACFKVTTCIEYRKILNSDTFLIGCADNDEHLAAFLEDPRCEYRWLSDKSEASALSRDVEFLRVRIDDREIPLLKTEKTGRGYEVWCGSNELTTKIGQEVAFRIEITTRKVIASRDYSVYLIYPTRGMDITFDYQGAGLRNVREIPFFAGKQPCPDLRRDGDRIQLQINDREWIFPTSGVTFLWDYEERDS